MDHAEVRERLEEAFATGAGISSIERDTSSDGADLRRHLDGCVACRREYDAWRTTALAMAAVAPEDLRAPENARGRILSSIAAAGVPVGGPIPVAATPRGERPAPAPAPAPAPDARWLSRTRPQAPRPALLAIAAGFAALLFMAGALLGGSLGLVPQVEDDDAGARIAAAVDRILARPDHVLLPLSDASGTPAGSILFDAHTDELVVLSRALPEPAEGQVYACFLERNGERTRVGRMRVEYGTAWWAGAMPAPSDAGAPGDRFVVVLGDETSPPILSGSF